LKQLDIFKDKKFQSLNLAQKQSITNNYFDKEMADEEFSKLEASQQTEIKSRFVDAQLDFDLSDTAGKIADAVQGFISPASEIASNPIQKDTPIYDANPTAPNADGTIPKAPNVPLVVDTGAKYMQSEDVTATKAILDEPKKTTDYVNPESGEYELGKRLVNRTNELTSNAIQGTYNFLGNIKSPMEYLGLSTEAMDAQNKKRADWFKKASDKLNDFVYEKNQLQLNAKNKPTHSWDEVKKGFSTGGIFDADAWQELGNYIGSEGIASVPDMAEMVATLPLYYASRQQESAENRAKNDGRTDPTKADYLATAPTTIGSIILDRFSLKAITEDVVNRIGKEALSGDLKSVAKVIGVEMKDGFVKEGTTEAVQNPLEQFGEEIGTKKGLSSTSEYADTALAGFVAGAGMGAGLSGATATGSEMFNTYTKDKQEKAKDAYVQDMYNKQMLGGGLVSTVDDTGHIQFVKNLETKVNTIKSEFENLIINHPEHNIPVEAEISIAVQEEVINKAKADGLDVSDNNGLNAIDKGFKELEQTIGGEPLAPMGETETKTVIDKPRIGEPEPEGKDSVNIVSPLIEYAKANGINVRNSKNGTFFSFGDKVNKNNLKYITENGEKKRVPKLETQFESYLSHSEKDKLAADNVLYELQQWIEKSKERKVSENASNVKEDLTLDELTTDEKFELEDLQAVKPAESEVKPAEDKKGLSGEDTVKIDKIRDTYISKRIKDDYKYLDEVKAQYGEDSTQYQNKIAKYKDETELRTAYEEHFKNTFDDMLSTFDDGNMEKIHSRLVLGMGFEQYKKGIEAVRDINFGKTQKSSVEAIDKFFDGKYTKFLEERDKASKDAAQKKHIDTLVRMLDSQNIRYKKEDMSRKDFLDKVFAEGFTTVNKTKRGAVNRYSLSDGESSFELKKNEVEYIDILSAAKTKAVLDAEEQDKKDNPDKYLSDAEAEHLFSGNIGSKSDIIKQEVQDNENTGTRASSTNANQTNNESGISTGEQQTPKQPDNKGSTARLSDGNRRPNRLGENGSVKDEVSDVNVGVVGHETDGSDKLPQQQSTYENPLLPKSDESNSNESYSLEGKTPVELTRGQRKKFNDAALEIIKKPLEEITEADRETLRHYTGEGGLGKASENSVNQHYTNYATVQSIYKALSGADVPMNKVLEPAVGSGNFVGFLPDASWDVVDIDTTNIEVTKRLYPQIKNFYAETYETFQGKNYDLIVSNVPFASAEMLMRIHAMTIKPAFKAIHNFYFAHSIDKVKDNGVVAFMTSTGTMDGTTTARVLRKYLMDRGDIVGAFRLPEKSQAKNAHTDTMIDIIFIQKRPASVKSRQEAKNNQFVNIGNKGGFPINEYFIAHPENLLGDEVVVGRDKNKMGTEGWIVRGTPKYENIKISYEPYTAIKKETKEENLFDNDTAVFAYAKEHGLEVSANKSTNLNTHSVISDSKIVYYDKVFSFTESEAKGMFGKVIKGDNTQKALLLNRIMTLTEDGLRAEDKAMIDLALSEIENYKSLYNKSPHNDLSIKKFMKEHKLDLQLKEFMSYFDKDFIPAAIYVEKTRFKDSGSLEIDGNSPLTDKALYYSTGDAVIDTSKTYEFLSAKELVELEINRSFVKSGANQIQLDFMYYSGNVYKKLDALEALKADNNIDKKAYGEQYKKLKSIIPAPIPFKNMTVKGGESWLPTIVKDKLVKESAGELFVKDAVFEGDFHKSELYNRYLNKKALAPKGKDESDAENIQRTMEATKLLSEVLVPQIMSYLENNGLAEILTDEYNKHSNFYVRPEMTGVLLRELPKSFRGKPFNMQSHQLQGAEKLVFNKKGILAFAPGGGKTPTAIVAVMNLIQQRVMKKPLFVVPVNTIAQWENTVKELYPHATVFEFPKLKSGVNKGNAKEWTQLSREEKEQMAYDLANNRYDFTIIGDTMFQKFGLPSDVLSEYVDDLVEQIQAAEEAETEEADSKNTRNTKKEKKGISAEAKKKALKNGLRQAYSGDIDFNFAKLGFDGLIADEVQYYKNIGLGGRDIKGGLGATTTISYFDKEGKSLAAKEIADGAEPHSATLGSMRSYDFRFKSKFVSQNNNGNNVILLTGTPTPNKPLELYTLLQHLDENILKEYGIESSKDFVDTFYDIEEFETTDTTGKIVKREGLASMKNLDWMAKILDRFVDYKGFKDMPELPRPKQVDVQHYLKLSNSGEAIFQDVQHRLIKAMEDAKLIKQGMLSSEYAEIPLVALGAGRSASIDLRLYDVGTKGKSLFTPDELYEIIKNDNATFENNKILKTIDLISNQYKENSNSGQIVFLDRLTVKNSDGSKTSTHVEMRDKILATGLFNENEVVFVNGGAFVNPLTGKVSKGSIKPEMLNRIMDMYNDGRIKVTIGNTSKLGVGVDLNRKTTDIYQLDILWRPDEIEQRSNRGVRQGNENSEVRVHQFFQLGTFDKRSYETVMKKRGFNDMYKFSENEDLVTIDGVSHIDNSNSTDPYQAIIDLESNPFERERLRKQRVVENAVVDANNLKNLALKLEADIRTKQGSIKNYTDGIKGIDDNLQPKNFPKYEGVKDEAEKKEKLEKHLLGLNERKVKYEKSIQDIEAEMQELNEKLSIRQKQKTDHEAETKFITDEFTKDGKNVDIEKIKAVYSLEQILKSEGKTQAEMDAYIENATDKSTSNSYMKVAEKKPNFEIVGGTKDISRNATQIHLANELRDLASINDKPIIAYLNELLKKHPESFKSEKDVFKHIIDVKNSATYIMQGSNPSNAMIVKSVNGITKKIGIEKNNDEVNLLVHALISTRMNELKRLIRKQLERSPTLSLHNMDTANGANALSTASDNISLSKEEEQSQDTTNSYARANGYDEAGANYIPTYGFTGVPFRPADSVIKIGDREVELPTIDKPINADSLRVYLSDIIGNRLYDAKVKGKSALGVYKRNDSAIRVKHHSDIEILAHEMAHFLDFFFNNKKKDARGSWFRSEILKNKDEIKALSYTTNPKEVLSEGFAEFVRLWLTNYNALALVAPNMVKDFENRLAKDKELNKKMITLQDGMHKFYYQGANIRTHIGGELDSTAKKIKRSQSQIAKDMRQGYIDKIHSIKRIEAEIRGDNSADALNSPYKSLQLVNGASSLMHTAMNFGVPTVQDNGDISYSGKSINEIFTPVTKVGEDRVKLLEEYLVAKRASELMEQKRENLISQAAIDAGLELATVYPEFESIFNDYQEFNDGMLDFYVGMNLITTSQRDNFREMNRNYVPFHRISESVQFDGSVTSKIGQRLTGSTASLNNIMENIINGIERNIKEALISRGKSVFYKMLEDSGMGGVYATRVATESKIVKDDLKAQAKKVATVMAMMGITISKDGMILSGKADADVYDVNEIEDNLLHNPKTLEVWTHGHVPTSADGYIDSAIINDKVVYFETKDAGLVDAMTSFKSSQHEPVVQALMVAKNIMTWNITNNPLFYFTNFARDTISAGVLSKNGFVPVMSSIAGMYHFIIKSPVYKEFMASGAGYGTRRTSLGGDVDAMAMLEVNRGFAVLSRVIGAMEYGADIFEYGTRVGDFALSQKNSKSNMQSAFEAREVSTDFAIKGSKQGWTTFMATVPFMKAGINGIDKTARRIFSLNGEMKFNNALKFRNQLGELQAHKLKLYATGGIIAALSLALWFNNKDDDRYKKLTRDQKLMYWHFFVGDEHIKIPRPYDIGFAFATLPEIIADGIYTKHGKDSAKDFVWGVKTMFSVGNISGLFQPILDDMTNTNWTGSPIVPTYLENLDDKGDQYLNSTPLVYKELGKATGISPIKTQHYVDGYLGLTAKMTEEITENMLWNTKEWGERPFAKNPLEFMTYRFKGKKQESRSEYSEKYYELMKKAGSVKNSFEAKKKKAFMDKGEDIKEYMSEKEKGAYVQVSKLMTKYNKILTQIKNSVEHIIYDKKYSKAEKEDLINKAYEAKTSIFKEVSEKLELKLKELGDK